MKKEIEEMRESMIASGFYTIEDIEKICILEADFSAECERISEQCVAEGYPSRGSTYDLRCSEARKFYDEQIDAIDSKYE